MRLSPDLVCLIEEVSEKMGVAPETILEEAMVDWLSVFAPECMSRPEVLRTSISPASALTFWGRKSRASEND